MRKHRDTGNLEATLWSWRSNRPQARVSDEAEERLWRRLIHSCQELADREAPRYCRNCGADQNELGHYV